MIIIDITYDINEHTKLFSAPWHSKFNIKQLGKIDTVGRETRQITIGTHTATHVDAPLHFIKQGLTVDKIPIEILVGKVTIIDFSFLNEDTKITVDMVKDIEVTERMIFNFGWGKYWGTEKFYKNYPHFSEEAALYLIANGLKLLGMDTCSPDDSCIKFGSEEDSKIHKMFLKKNIFILEYLAGLNTLNDLNNWNISAAPIKITGADGFPVRAYLFKEE